MKMYFDYFEMQKWMLQKPRVEKVVEKRGHLSSFHVSFLSYGHFLIFCAELSKKSKSVKAIYIYCITVSSNTNISETISHSIINNTILWKCTTRPFRYIYVNCFNKLKFLLRSAQNCKKCAFLNSLSHNSCRKHWN